MTTYYYGIIEFGEFNVDSRDPSPMAIIHRVDEVKEFDRPAEAWAHWEQSSSDAYISVDAKDEFDVQYELVFKHHV